MRDMNASQRYPRWEFYKARGETLAVPTCECCKLDGHRDAWVAKGRTDTHSLRPPKGRREEVLLGTKLIELAVETLVRQTEMHTPAPLEAGSRRAPLKCSQSRAT
jgi:hypothetical protein